jgi:hypothetical protein
MPANGCQWFLEAEMIDFIEILQRLPTLAI